MSAIADTSDLIRGFLCEAPLLAPLDHDDRADLAASARLVSVTRGTKLYTKGDLAEDVYFVASGRVQCCQHCEGPREWVIGVVHTAGAFGLLEVLCGVNRGGCALALETTKVVAIPGACLTGLMDRRHEFATHVARTLAQEVLTAQHMCGSVALQPPLHRLAEYLVTTAGQSNAGELPETQGRIASQIGTVREVVGRSLRRLERQGVIARHGRRFEILKRDELERLAK